MTILGIGRHQHQTHSHSHTHTRSSYWATILGTYGNIFISWRWSASAYICLDIFTCMRYDRTRALVSTPETWTKMTVRLIENFFIRTMDAAQLCIIRYWCRCTDWLTDYDVCACVWNGMSMHIALSGGMNDKCKIVFRLRSTKFVRPFSLA